MKLIDSICYWSWIRRNSEPQTQTTKAIDSILASLQFRDRYVFLEGK